MVSLSRIAHQMWLDHPFNQRNKTIEWGVGVGVGGEQEIGGWTKFEKWGVGNKGGSL